MDGLTKSYGTKKVFENIRLNFLPGVKIGVVGVNGSGKSSLLKIMAGLDKDYTGEAWAAEGATVGYLPQEPELDPALDVRGNVMEGVAPKRALLERYNEVAMKVAEDYSDELMEEMTALQDQIDAQNLWDLDSQVDVAMEALRCPPDEASVDTLSGGERRRVALCKLLLEAPDMLLLDEPTNHLDAETIAWLQKHLIEYKGTILIVTHDRYFLDEITGWILELDRGRGIPYEGNYSAWLEQKAKRLEQEAREDKSRQKTLARELEWIRQGAKARQAKQKARINAYNELANQSERDRITRAQIIIPNGPRLGGNVIDVEGVTKAYGDKLLIDDLTFALPPGGIVGVIGPNGAGKTTLFRMLTGQEEPDAARSPGARPSSSPTSTSPATPSTPEDRLGGDLRRPRRHQARRRRDELPRLLRRLQLQGRRPAEEGRPPLGRRAQPRPPRQAPARGRQRPPPRRADQRPRRRDPARPRGRPRRLRRLRRGDLPRPLLPRPHLHPHARLRGRGPCRVVRGQLRGLRGRQDPPPRAGRGGAEADQVQEVRAVAFRKMGSPSLSSA
jgi:ATPase subunit of ABC transporter with duplicated ATPase domains